MLRLGIEDVRAAAFAGSTASEIECGMRAGAAVVAGVLTGGHTSDRLRSAGATHLIDGITQLPDLLPGRSTAEDAGSVVGDSARTAAASSGPAARPSSPAASSAAPAAARGRRYP
jgi:hypothetical protein